VKPGETGMQSLNDAEIARRALKLLAERKMVPTPETFADAFWESAGVDARSQEAVGVLKDLGADLVRQSRMSQQEAAQMVQAAQRHQWGAVRDAAGRALARKSGAVADAWQQLALRSLAVLGRACAGAGPARQRLREYSARSSESGSNGAPPAPGASDWVSAVEREIAEEQSVRAGLQRLLGLLCENLAKMAPEEAWLHGQLEPIRELLAGRLRSEQIAAAERRLGEFATQQTQARRGLQEAKVALTEMMATLLDRVGAMGSSAERFNDRVDAYQTQLQQSPDLATLSRIVHGLLTDTRTVRGEIEASRAELIEARKRVGVYEARVSQLEQQLNEVSTLAQKDPLTNALNRRGLEHAFDVECARALRYQSPLTLVMMDLDNFKQVNDRLGHVAGDRALIHFVTTVHATLRPTDLTARYGGEEFGVLFPAGAIQEGVEAIERLQRELGRRPFQFENDGLILTFSAGVAQWRAGETLEQLMRRADAALYQAKNAGKNRVLMAP
jgi:diguanylate cyclase (GGDEF)-like protein